MGRIHTSRRRAHHGTQRRQRTGAAATHCTYSGGHRADLQERGGAATYPRDSRQDRQRATSAWRIGSDR